MVTAQLSAARQPKAQRLSMIDTSKSDLVKAFTGSPDYKSSYGVYVALSAGTICRGFQPGVTED
jgi:hypothetical protein